MNVTLVYEHTNDLIDVNSPKVSLIESLIDSLARDVALVRPCRYRGY